MIADCLMRMFSTKQALESDGSITQTSNPAGNPQTPQQQTRRASHPTINARTQ
jgi:hypothetical protein